MIRVNLAAKGKTGKIGKTKSPKPSVNIGPRNFTPFLLILVVIGFAGYGYSWYMRLAGQSAALDESIQQAEAQKAALEAVIKQDQIYETRKKMLERRVKIIEGLQNNQVSPVIVLDQLAHAVEKTKYVWLSNLDQKDSVLSMSGTGTSLNAIADLYSNLLATGYFTNIDLGTAQESGENYTFSLKCEFLLPHRLSHKGKAEAGGN
jgi:Tfp pilus assembly protein PilN